MMKIGYGGQILTEENDENPEALDWLDAIVDTSE